MKIKDGTFKVVFPVKARTETLGDRLSYFDGQIYEELDKKFPLFPEQSDVERHCHLDVADFRKHGEKRVVWHVKYW